MKRHGVVDPRDKSKPVQGFDLLGQLETNFGTKYVDICTFAESPKFCNKTLYPRQKLLLKILFLELENLTPDEHAVIDYWEAGGREGNEIEISPGLRDRMADLKAKGYPHFREVSLVGGRRCSKGFLTAIALTKKLYDLHQLGNPIKDLGADEGKEIYFACVAAALDQAKSAQYADLSSTVLSCAALQPYTYKTQHLEFSVHTDSDIQKLDDWKRHGRRVEKDIASLRGKALPANARTIRGLAMIALVLDEVAHFQQGESDQSDMEVYNAAKPSLDQFGRKSIRFLNSSPYSKVGLLYERYEAGLAMDNGKPVEPDTLTLRFPSWALYEGWWKDPHYIGPKHCQVPSPDWDPDAKNKDGSFVHSEDDRAGIWVQRQEELANPDKYKVEHRGRFAEVVDAYLIPEMVDRMFEGRPIMYDKDKNEWTYESFTPNWDMSSNQIAYYAHLDPSSTTAGFGFALGHVEEFEFFGNQEQHVVFDIIKRWNPRDFGGTIDWEPILEWLLHICDLFRPIQLSMDQFNTDYPLSWLNREFRKRRIETRAFKRQPTSQTNWQEAEIFKTALNRGFIHAPDRDYLEDLKYASEELKYLQEIKSTRIPRVQKQEVGPITTDDMAKCMFSVVDVLIGNVIAKQTREDLGGGLRMGSPGGYPIGGPDRAGHGRSLPQGARGALAELYEKRSNYHRRVQMANRYPARGISRLRRGR